MKSSTKETCRLVARLQKKFKKPSMTKQAPAEDADVNNILKKYAQTGVITHTNPKQALYGDFSNAKSYQEALNGVLDAQEQFDALPSQIRERFKNNPAELLSFLDNQDNRDEAIELGLIIDNSDSGCSSSAEPTSDSALVNEVETSSDQTSS